MKMKNQLQKIADELHQARADKPHPTINCHDASSRR
jgi:hypothetical protein